MKANRFLTPAELDLIDIYREKLGEIYPKNFKKSIPTKLGMSISFFNRTRYFDLCFVIRRPDFRLTQVCQNVEYGWRIEGGEN